MINCYCVAATKQSILQRWDLDCFPPPAPRSSPRRARTLSSLLLLNLGVAGLADVHRHLELLLAAARDRA